MKTDLRLTDTNAASDSKGRTWGLEGSLFWWLVGGIGAAITVFFLLLVVFKLSLSVSLDNKTPQHAVLLGMSGAGKSVTVCDLLTQTEGYFGYTVIIEEGLSYGIYTATVEEGARPIIIHPDGDLTINYLDTKGLPLTPDHLSAATALVARMIGTSVQEDKQMLRQAQIAKYINLLYEDAFQDWQKKRHDELLDIARHALALQKFPAERMPP